MAVENNQENTQLSLNSTAYEFDYFCLAENSPILIKSREGQIAIKFVQDIALGDQVLSLAQNGQQVWKPAELTYRRAPEDILTLRAKNQIYITHTHKLFRPNFELEAAGNLTEGEEVMSVTSLSLPTNRERIDLLSLLGESLPNWFRYDDTEIWHNYNHSGKRLLRHIALDYNFGLVLGLYLAEGSTAPNLVQFALHLDERELSELLEDIIPKTLGLSVTTKTWPEYTRRVAYIFHKTAQLVFDKICPGHASAKEIPFWCYDSSMEFKRGLLHGWIFGDAGCNDRTILGKSTSRKLTAGMQNIALALGVPASVIEILPEEDNCEIAWGLCFCGREIFEKLFPRPVVWKHYDKIADYLAIGNTEKVFTRKQTSRIFMEYYEPGMKKEDFLARAGYSEAPFIRHYGSWMNLLREHGFSDYIHKWRGISKTDLILLAWDWLNRHNWDFSESLWNTDKTVPSMGLIRKYFGTSRNFYAYIRKLTANDIARLSKPPINTEVSATEITLAQTISYPHKFVYDLRVVDNENFLIGNIVSHNSGTQISMYVGDVLIDDLVSIQFQVTQGKRPIYGYASQYFDAVADGQVIVEGNFTINFKESDYLIATLKRYADKMPFEQVATQGAWTKKEGWGKDTEWDYVLKRENIERMLERQSREIPSLMVPGSIGDANRFKFYQDLAALPDKAFEDAAEVFEDKIWQDPKANYDTGNVISRKDIDETKYRRADQYPPIDIWILYGDVSNKAANHTIKKLEQVYILGTGQGIEANGVPILEQYRFMARNLV